MKGIGSTIMDGDPKNVLERNAGLFLNCKVRLYCFLLLKTDHIPLNPGKK
jgi:hypothetical protein